MPEVFVFGSNREGRHGKGAARTANEQWGARHGVAEGPTGDAYAIVTKELRSTYPPVSLAEVAAGVERFLAYAKARPEVTFVLTRIGCGLAGFEARDIAPLFADAPPNVHQPRWEESK